MASSRSRPTSVRLKPHRGASGEPFMNTIVSALQRQIECETDPRPRSTCVWVCVRACVRACVHSCDDDAHLYLKNYRRTCRKAGGRGKQWRIAIAVFVCWCDEGTSLDTIGTGYQQKKRRREPPFKQALALLAPVVTGMASDYLPVRGAKRNTHT